MNNGLKRVLTAIFSDMNVLTPEEELIAKENFPSKYMISTRDGIMKQLWMGYDLSMQSVTITYLRKDCAIITHTVDLSYIFSTRRQ